MKLLSALRSPLVAILAAFLMTPAFSQTFTAKPGVKTSDKSLGFYEYLPEGYSTATDQKYPLIIFAHGAGETGNGNSDLSRVLANGTPKQINNGTFPKSFVVKGQTFRFIVLVPQFTAWPGEKELGQIMDYAEKNYRVDPERIYITGLSMGGAAVCQYAGASSANSLRIAAMVPVCEAAAGSSQMYNNIAQSNLPVWATHNQNDGTVPSSKTVALVNGINAYGVPPDPKAKMTIFPVSGHDAWTKTYDLAYREDGMNVYEWMLTHTRREQNILAVFDLKFSARENSGTAALKWNTSRELNNLGFSVERSRDGKVFDSLAFISSQGESGGIYTFTDKNPENGQNFYRLKAVESTGKITYSNVIALDIRSTAANKISIYPNPVSNILNFQTDYNPGSAVLRIFDISGRAVVERTITGSGNHSIPLNLPSGMYSAILVENGRTAFKQSFIKN